MRTALAPSNVCYTVVPEEAGRQGRQAGRVGKQGQWQAGNSGLQGRVAVRVEQLVG